MSETLGRYRKLYASGLIEGRRVNSIPLEAEAWLWRLMMIADDYGNLPADEAILGGRAAPLRALRQPVIRRLTATLENARLIWRYSCDGEEYLHIAEFERFQAASNGKRVRRYPQHLNPEKSKTIQAEANSSNSPESVFRSPNTEVRIPSSAGSPDGESRRKHDPLAWSPDSGWEGVTDQDREAWRIAYPAVGLDSEMARADQWLRANPEKAKKTRWRRFLTGWFGRSQERGGGMPSRASGRKLADPTPANVVSAAVLTNPEAISLAEYKRRAGA